MPVTAFAQWDAQTAPAPPLHAAPAALPDAAAIPPRQWLYGTALIRRFVSVLIAPGGVGKSALALGQAVALASGRNFLAERVHHSVPAWVLNLEDPLEETERRLAALMRRHGIARSELEGRLFLHSGRERRVTMAAMADDGWRVVLPDKEAVIAGARAAGVGLIVVDPFVKSHALEENNNAQMDAAATAWAEVAEETGAAILLVHHVRKGAAEDVDAARGGKALTDAARAARLLSVMTEEEAERLDVAPNERWRHVRLDDAKANLAPRADKALWYKLETVNLDNATADYPAGDNVAVMVPFHPGSMWNRLSAAEINRVLDEIDAGHPDGSLYAPYRRGGGSYRWAGHVLARRLGLAEAQAAQMLQTWMVNGLLVEAEYKDRVQRKSRTGLRVMDALRPTVGSAMGATEGFVSS